MSELQLVPLVTVGSPMEAKLVAARLGAAGIVWQLRGPVDDPYPLGDVTVLVDAAELAEARALLEAAPAPEDDPEGWWDDDGLPDQDESARWRRRVVGVGVLVLAAGFALARVAAAVA